jgi:predicted O-methyltransferase YrrM
VSIIDDPSAWGGWTLGARGAQLIAEALEQRKPSYILEAGSGSSTVVLAEYAKRSRSSRRRRPRIISLESDAAFFQKTTDLLVRHDLSSQVDLRLTPLTGYRTPIGNAWWYEVDRVPHNIDFVLVDGPPGHHSTGRIAALTALWPLLAPDFELWLDDVHRQGEKLTVKSWATHYGVTVTGIVAGRKQMARVRR